MCSVLPRTLGQHTCSFVSPAAPLRVQAQVLAHLSCIADLAAAGATSRAWRSVVASLDSRWPAVQRMALGPAAADPAVPLRWAARCLPSLTDLDLNGVPQLQPEHLAAFAHEGTPLKVSSLVFTGPPSAHRLW